MWVGMCARDLQKAPPLLPPMHGHTHMCLCVCMHGHTHMCLCVCMHGHMHMYARDLQEGIDPIPRSAKLGPMDRMEEMRLQAAHLHGHVYMWMWMWMCRHMCMHVQAAHADEDGD